MPDPVPAPSQSVALDASVMVELPSAVAVCPCGNRAACYVRTVNLDPKGSNPYVFEWRCLDHMGQVRTPPMELAVIAPSQSVEREVARLVAVHHRDDGTPVDATEFKALIEAVRREQDGLALVAAARVLANQAEIVTTCQCEEAWTSRRMHESNSWCGYLDEEIASVRAALGEQDGDHHQPV